MSRSKETILVEIAGEEQRLADLEREIAQARARREQLLSELETSSAASPIRSAPSARNAQTPHTPGDKVDFFRSLFRGRPDIFPTRFVSKKTGKAGYAPECSNKFRAGLCILKTGGRCGDCSNQAFSPVSDQAILDHLQGRHVMGVYPLLEDDTCWFLAADFDRFRAFVRHLVVLHGGMTPKERRVSAESLASIPDTAERLVLATGRYLGEGFDDARLDSLFLAMPISWKGTLIQYSGRLHRRHPRKNEVRIYDYVDREVPMLLRMFEKRLRTYRAIGYARGEAPLGFAEPPEERTIEYDEEALRHFERNI